MRRSVATTAAVALVAVAVGATVAGAPARLGLGPRHATPASAGAARAALAGMALRFEPNQGQTDPSVRFVARSGAGNVYLTDTEAVFALNRPTGKAATAVAPAVVRMRAVGARTVRPETGVGRLPGLSNYLIGNDPSKWQRRVPAYAGIEYRGVYPGVDLVYHGERGALEYDFVVAPGGEPDRIRLAFEGQRGLALDAGGDLVLATTAGPLRHRAPVTYQDVNGRRRPVESRYTLDQRGRVGFHVGGYDPTRPLVIDPQVAYASYLGGAGWDKGAAVAADAGGNAYVTGWTGSLDFPGAPRPPLEAEPQFDVFVAKLTPDLSDLVYATYFGGRVAILPNSRPSDLGYGVAVDSQGQAHVTGITQSDDFPTTPGAYKPVVKGDTESGPGDGFITKLNAAGTGIVYSTLIGALIKGDQLFDIAVDGAGDAYVVGQTRGDFPTTPTAFQAVSQADAGDGRVNAVLAKLRPGGRGPADLVYSTLLGGSYNDTATGVAVDARGRAWVSGSTSSVDDPNKAADEAFPTTPDAIKRPAPRPSEQPPPDAFLAIIDPSLAGNASLVYSTVYGGSESDVGGNVAVLASGEAAWITGRTASDDFPTTVGALRRTWSPADAHDGYVALLRPGSPRFLYSTYLRLDQNSHGYGAGDVAADPAGDAWVTGGSRLARLHPGGAGAGDQRFDLALGAQGQSVALDPSGGVVVVGTSGAGFTTTAGVVQPAYGGGESDAFVVKLGPPPSPPEDPPPLPSPPPPPSVGISDVSITEGDEGTVEASFPVFLTAASAQAVTVEFTTVDGSATAGLDYVAGSGTVSFPPGTTAQLATVAVLGDTLVEPDETFFVELSDPVNAGIGVGAALGTIVDDDDPAVAADGSDTSQDPASADSGDGQIPSPAQPQPGPQPQPQPAPQPGPQPQPHPAPQAQPTPTPQPQVQPQVQPQIQAQVQPQAQVQVQVQVQPGVMAQRQRAPGVATEGIAGRDLSSDTYLASARRPAVAPPAAPALMLVGLAVLATPCLCAGRLRRRPSPARAPAHPRPPAARYRRTR